MSFDPFGDFETRGYLRNVFGEKDPDIIKHLEHSAFVAGIAEASKHLASISRLSYGDVLRTHEILFRDLYPWAGQDRMRTVPEIAVSKGPVLFAHPRDAKAAVEYGLKLGSDVPAMKARPGEVMGYLAFGHPFLDGNGRTIMVVHAELAERAGFSIEWTATRSSWISTMRSPSKNYGYEGTSQPGVEALGPGGRFSLAAHGTRMYEHRREGYLGAWPRCRGADRSSGCRHRCRDGHIMTPSAGP